MVSVNLEAKKTVDVMIEKADELNIDIVTLANGATVLDCGVNVDGSFKAGELYTKVCLGGLADVGISIPGDLSEKFALPSVKIKTDSPSISTLGSQKAGWSVSTAHPAKFKESVERILDLTLPLPEVLDKHNKLPLLSDEMENDFAQLRAYLLK